MSENKKIVALKAYFHGRKDVLMAFLFGSQANGRISKHSDWDIGIYFKLESKYLEWEESKFYPQENSIWQDVEKIVESETDLIVLNRAPSPLVFSILNEGRPLIIKDRGVYLDLLNKTNYEAIDFRDFSYDFWQIKERSQSLTAQDKTRLLELVDFLAGEAEDFKKFRDLTWQDYQSQRSLRREVERWVENIVNASLDIGKILLASERKNIPSTYQEVLRLLGTTGLFDVNFSQRFSQWAKLRNILAHRYLDLRWEQIQRFIQEAPKDTLYFIDRIKSQLS